MLKRVCRLPDMSGRHESRAIVDGADTALGRELAKEVAKHPSESGTRLLAGGLDAFVARAALARSAEKSIDLQYYMFHQDTVGQLLTLRLLDAADRGVRVRMLIDDLYGDVDERAWVALDAHPRIEVRLFNPWKRDRTRVVQFALRFCELNHRMHVKSFTVDGQATILGGRNIADAYFDADENLAFADMDVMAVGSPVGQVADVFDGYWNSPFAWPVDILVGRAEAGETDRLRETLRARQERSAASAYVTALRESGLARELGAGSVSFDWSPAEVLADPPDKMVRSEGWKDRILMARLAPVMLDARETLDIVSPYFVPGREYRDALCDLARRGVRVRILTNSLASNDVSAVHAGYAKYRGPLLRCGVELYEFDESFRERAGKTFTWLPGLAKSSLHAKTIVVDGETMFVGSFNFDRRSIDINNEIGLVIRNRAVAGKAARDFAENVSGVAFKVEFSKAGGGSGMRWLGGQGGPDVVMKKEPHATATQKLIAGILKWLPVDSQL